MIINPFATLPFNKDKIYSSILVEGGCKVYFPLTKEQEPHIQQIKTILLDYLTPEPKHYPAA